jgi:superfamily II DNA or RNA helicase
MELTISEYNQVYDKVYCEPGIAMELSEHFTFYAHNYKYTPQYKSGSWDGRIRLYHTRKQEIYAGMRHHVIDFANQRDYKVNFIGRVGSDEVSALEVEEFITKLGLPPDRTPYDYQVKAIIESFRNKRSLLISPTSSGKSLIAYMLTRWYARPTLIVVPTVALVNQLYSDFQEYGFDSERYCHRIFQGKEKVTNKPIVITTWHSVFEMPKSWFDRFQVVIGDEAHTFKATSLVSIMGKLVDCEYRFGMTGTLDGSTIHQWVLEGLFGKMIKVISTKELQDSGRAADLRIKCITLSHDEDTRKKMKKMPYQQELDFIVTNEKRNKFIRNLALSLEGNSLLLFQFVEKQGKVLFKMLKEKYPEKDIFYVSGEVDADARENIRQLAENNSNIIIVASYGTFSTGVNIRNLHNIVFCSPSKSRIRVLQSIGRGLRLHASKEFMTLIDISDDMTWKSYVNSTYKHFEERLKIYNNEGFNYKLYRVEL